jgi:hypothetical protein
MNFLRQSIIFTDVLICSASQIILDQIVEALILIACLLEHFVSSVEARLGGGFI